MSSHPSPATPPHVDDDGVAAALAGLRDLDGLPVVDHVSRFNAVHEALVAALSRIDEV